MGVVKQLDIEGQTYFIIIHSYNNDGTVHGQCMSVAISVMMVYIVHACKLQLEKFSNIVVEACHS